MPKAGGKTDSTPKVLPYLNNKNVYNLLRCKILLVYQKLPVIFFIFVPSLNSHLLVSNHLLFIAPLYLPFVGAAFSIIVFLFRWPLPVVIFWYWLPQKNSVH